MMSCYHCKSVFQTYVLEICAICTQCIFILHEIIPKTFESNLRVRKKVSPLYNLSHFAFHYIERGMDNIERYYYNRSMFINDVFGINFVKSFLYLCCLITLN